MTNQDVSLEERFKKIVAGIFHLDENAITAETKFVEDLHAKSVDTIALLAALEGEFKIRIPPQEVLANKTVGDALAYLKSKLEVNS